MGDLVATVLELCPNLHEFMIHHALLSSKRLCQKLDSVGDVGIDLQASEECLLPPLPHLQQLYLFSTRPLSDAMLQQLQQFSQLRTLALTAPNSLDCFITLADHLINLRKIEFFYDKTLDEASQKSISLPFYVILS